MVGQQAHSKGEPASAAALASRAVEGESLLTVSAQTSASTVKSSSPAIVDAVTAAAGPAQHLQPLTIPPHTERAAALSSPTSLQVPSGSADGLGGKQKSFQWRDLLSPEFYPEVTVRRSIFFLLWTIPHIVIIVYFVVAIQAPLESRMNKASKASILFDMAAILVFMSPTFLSLLRHTFLPRFITFEKNIHAHKVAAYTLLFWAAVHIGIHYQRFINQAKPAVKNGRVVPGVPMHVNLFEKMTGKTGHTMMFSFLVMAVAAIKPIRKRYFELFYYTHHLFILNIVLLHVHFENHTTYKYISGPLALYCVDRLYRNLRSAFARSSIRAVVQHPSGVVEVLMDKKIFNYRPGQYVKLYCPSVSLLQWHPVTISSAPEEDFLSIHFRLEGGWTRRLSRRLGCDFGADARTSSIQNIVTKTPGTDTFNASKVKQAKHGSSRPVSQALDIPYHPLHHDPTTIPMYSQVGGNSSYVSIDMVTKGGSAAVRNGAALADDAKSIAKVTTKDKAAAKGISASSSSELENGNMVIRMGAELPVIFVDGPYSAPTEHFFEYEVGVLIAAGIGVTPAASVLRSVYFQWLQNRSAMTTKKVYLFWVYRDIGTIEWFKDLIIALKEEGLESIVEICTYFTGRIPETRIPQLTPAEDRFGDQVIGTSIGTKSYIGRPDFSDIFESLGERHPGTRIGTFFCGPKPMARKVRREAHRWDKLLNKQHGTNLDFYTETFS